MDAIKAANDQSLFREVNEKVRDLNESLEHATRGADFMCECAQQDCIEPVAMTADAYEEIRRVPTHFAVAAGTEHVFPEIERIFAKRDGYLVVEKFGEAGVAATKLDPRRHASLVERKPLEELVLAGEDR